MAEVSGRNKEMIYWGRGTFQKTYMFTKQCVCQCHMLQKTLLLIEYSTSYVIFLVAIRCMQVRAYTLWRSGEGLLPLGKRVPPYSLLVIDDKKDKELERFTSVTIVMCQY